jgi:hypothetical protein
MSSNDTIQPNSSDTSDWSRAWQAVAKLASARESLQEISQTQSFSRSEYASSSSPVPGDNSALAAEPDQLSGALAEIEAASAALRRSEPLLEHGAPLSPAQGTTRRYWSVWVLIAAIWISASFVVATAACAILLILG